MQVKTILTHEMQDVTGLGSADSMQILDSKSKGKEKYTELVSLSTSIMDNEKESKEIEETNPEEP